MAHEVRETVVCVLRNIWSRRKKRTDVTRSSGTG